jgi:hypothetical protein
MTLSGCSRKGIEWILIRISLTLSFGKPNREVSTLCILSMTLSGCSRKGFGRILFWISLVLSFGNPQPGGFNPLYPFPDPFGLFEERNWTDSSPHPFGNPQPRGFFPLNPCHDPFGLFEERIRADSSLSIPTITLSSRSRGGVV